MWGSAKPGRGVRNREDDTFLRMSVEKRKAAQEHAKG